MPPSLYIQQNTSQYTYIYIIKQMYRPYTGRSYILREICCIFGQLKPTDKIELSSKNIIAHWCMIDPLILHYGRVSLGMVRDEKISHRG